jgi:hypothetical protein
MTSTAGLWMPEVDWGDLLIGEIAANWSNGLTFSAKLEPSQAPELAAPKERTQSPILSEGQREAVHTSTAGLWMPEVDWGDLLIGEIAANWSNGLT